MGSNPSRRRQVAQVPRQTVDHQFVPGESQLQVIPRDGGRLDTDSEFHESPDMLQWPLPPSPQYEPFQLLETVGYKTLELSVIIPRRETPPLTSVAAKTSDKIDKEEKSDNPWVQQKDSKIVGSAHVQSQVSSRFIAEYKSSTENNAQFLINRIRRAEEEYGKILQERLREVSRLAEKQIEEVINEMDTNEKRLLAYDKLIQEKQNELYKQWLQKYVVKLNEWRSKELYNLQNQLLMYQKQIADRSEEKIAMINKAASDLKAVILDEEKERAAKKTQCLTEEMLNQKRDKNRFLGSESKTEVNIRVQANVGRFGGTVS